MKTRADAIRSTSPVTLRARLQRRTAASAAHELSDTPPSGVHVSQRTFGNQSLMRAAERVLRDAETEAVAGTLRVGPADDRFEREADAVARQVAPGHGVTQGGAGDSVQRKEAGAGQEGGGVSKDFEHTLDSVRGGGSALPKETLGQMNQGFGADFSGVRVHDNTQSDALNRSINARAFTSGSDVFFRSGEYKPGTEAGQQTIAHELTHVVQQGGAHQGSIQRLIASATFRKNTKLFGRKGKSGADFANMVQALAMYEGPLQTSTPAAKIKHLTSMLAAIDTWLANRAAGKSSRRSHVVSLRSEVESELKNVKNQMPQAKTGDFMDDNVAKAEDGKYGEAMNTLDELTYDFGLDVNDQGEDIKVQGGTFTAVFKENLSTDPLTGKHRGAGIPAQNPEFAKRNLAMLAMDKLLGANVIPKTFLAKHNDKEGFIMEKVEGKTARQMQKDDKESLKDAMALPQVRRSLSNLYLLDMICAQVDRHPGNFVIEVENGVIKGVKGIDNDLAFGKDVDLEKAMTYNKGSFARGSQTAGVLVDELTEIDRTFAQKIIDLDGQPDLVKATLKDLLTNEEIEATLERITHLANFLRPMMNVTDGVIKSKWE